MKCSAITGLFLLSVTTLALPSASMDERSVKRAENLDKFLAPMTYFGPITPGGKNHSINGTAEEVHKKILELNPSFNPYDWHKPGIDSRDVLDPALASREALDALEKRAKKPPPNCNVFNYCNTGRIRQGIDYLNGLPGTCHVGWGSDKCARISCSYNSGITLCNDNYSDRAPPCRTLASFAQDIVNSCQSGNSVRGQLFDTDKFNII
ncbi:hypothetical protein MMC22_003237, partial [Lobaria immixta]|nr:hypothetical protein [Lobaria immixta]